MCCDVRPSFSIRGPAAGQDQVVPDAPVVVAEHEKIDRISVGAETSITVGGCNIDDVGEAEDDAVAIVVAGFNMMASMFEIFDALKSRSPASA